MPDAKIIRRETAQTEKPSTAQEQPRILAPLPTDDRLIPAADLTAYIGLAKQTLARMRHEGKGPPFVRVGRRIFYRSSDVREWLRLNSHSSTVYIGGNNT